MSWNIALAAKNAKEAKADLHARNKEQGDACPAEVVKAIETLIDALPKPMKGYSTVSVATYGHFAEEDVAQTSNASINVQHVADVG